jgi:GH25 family lysozyme M1 (1,4-beta-N-acetylmuramidase)
MKKFFTILFSLSFLSFLLHANPSVAADLVAAGPAGKIHGADISRWQHPNGKAINFKKMRSAGMDFVMIKASDTREESDRIALKYVKQDRKGAQAAGIHTGFYHFALLPNTTSQVAIERDAKAQAQKVIGRLATLGAYNDLDLPYALDLEVNCIQWSSNGTCLKSASREHATLWSKVFLKTVHEETGRTPLIYSSPHFLENSLIRDEELLQYPLWIAHYAIDPVLPESKPNVKPGGCFVHSWTSAECAANWTLWQYSSCGIAPKYGVPGSRLDLNVFSGDHLEFDSLRKGEWVPKTINPMPRGEKSKITITSVKAYTHDKNAFIALEVKRPDDTPVVTGAVKFQFTSAHTEKPVVEQKVVRENNGSFKLTLSGLPAGTWSGKVSFKDASGTHSAAYAPVDLTIVQGESSTTATPAPRPVEKPKTDSCRNQIKN